jgi:response regulator of citrate/malate metabolism
MGKSIRQFLPQISGWTRRGRPAAEAARPARVPVIALLMDAQDWRILASQDAFETHFAVSLENAMDLMKTFDAPVVLLDRDWPGSDWRDAIRKFASAGSRPCVILISAVADDHLWESVVRCGGSDVLVKPLQVPAVERVIKMALAYREFAKQAALSATSLLEEG